MHFTTSFFAGAVVALCATHVAAAPLAARAPLQPVAPQDSGAPTKPVWRNRLPVSQMGAEQTAATAEEATTPDSGAPTKPVWRNRLPVSQMGEGESSDKYKAEAVDGCGDAAKANDKDYFKCMTVDV